MSHYDENYHKVALAGLAAGAKVDNEQVQGGWESSPVQDNDLVSHPSHYNKHPSGIECKDVIEHFSYHLGCAVKYIWRCDEKGLPIQDLEKAIKSIQFEIDMRQRKR